jgi:hypothetical protein
MAPRRGMSVPGRWRRLLSDTYNPPDRVAPRAPLDDAAFDVRLTSVRATPTSVRGRTLRCAGECRGTVIWIS